MGLTKQDGGARVGGGGGGRIGIESIHAASVWRGIVSDVKWKAPLTSCQHVTHFPHVMFVFLVRTQRPRGRPLIWRWCRLGERGGKEKDNCAVSNPQEWILRKQGKTPVWVHHLTVQGSFHLLNSCHHLPPHCRSVGESRP